MRRDLIGLFAHLTYNFEKDADRVAIFTSSLRSHKLIESSIISNKVCIKYNFNYVKIVNLACNDFLHRIWLMNIED